MDLRESLRIKETSRVKIGAARYDELLASSETRLAEAEKSGAAPEEIEELHLLHEIVVKERERFFWEHDATGAWKGERFGRDLAKIFDESGLGRNEEGEAVLQNPEAAARTHLLQVNMGELDRLNASGDHALGDRGLELTFERVQAAVQDALQAKHAEASEKEVLSRFDVYRTAGNDFSVILKDADPEFAEMVREALSKPIDISFERSDQDPIPLSASRVSLEEGLSLLNRLDRGDVDPAADRRDAITVLQEKLQTVNDFEKSRTRAGRMAEALGGGQKKMDPRKLYDEFLKKYTGHLFLENGETGPLDFETFSKRIDDMGAHEDHPHEWKKRVFNAAREDALRQFRSRNSDRLGDAAHFAELVASDFDQMAADAGIQTRIASNIESAGEGKTLSRFGEQEKEALQSFQERLDAIGPTDGEKRVQALKDALDEATKEGGPHGDAKRKLAESELSLELAKRDRATGLYGRGVYFQTLESAVVSRSPMTAVAIDMAFLKYFDKEGGAKTGDAAIHAAGRILDAVARELKEKHGVTAEAFRVGGDEFAFAVQSEDEEVTSKIPDMLERISSEQIGHIPSHEGASSNYQPEALQFNVGSASSSRRGSPRIEEDGPPSSERRRKAADDLNHEADAAVASEKALNRFAFLLGRSLSAAHGAEAGSLQTLMTYSEKSIFGELGKAKIDAWTRDIMSARKTIADIVQSELQPFIAEELRRKGKEDVHFTKELVQRLEEDLERTFAGLRIRDLEMDVASAEAALGAEHEKVVSVKKEIAELQKSREDMASLRGKIASNG